jgi:hypothetical protein
MHTLRTIVLVMGLLATGAGCGGRPLGVHPAPNVTSDGGRDATIAPMDGSGGPVCPAPAACNDDPTMSALAGACVASGDYFYCQCADGFSINPTTQRCRAGNVCVAAAADAWPFRMTLDTSDCLSRSPTACGEPGSDPHAQVLAMLGHLSSKPGCSLPANLTVRVELVDGCATLLEGLSTRGDQGSLAQFYLDFLTCFGTELEATRFGCGTTADCYMAEWDTIVP